MREIQSLWFLFLLCSCRFYRLLLYLHFSDYNRNSQNFLFNLHVMYVMYVYHTMNHSFLWTIFLHDLIKWWVFSQVIIVWCLYEFLYDTESGLEYFKFRCFLRYILYHFCIAILFHDILFHPYCKGFFIQKLLQILLLLHQVMFTVTW